MKSISLLIATGLISVMLWKSFGGDTDEIQVFHGAADASALESINERWFVLADDEDNFLRLYRRDLRDGPVQRIDLRPFLNPGGKNPETDIEGCARIGDHLFWISSHARNASGKAAASRHRFFATRIIVGQDRPQLIPEGKPVTNLLEILEQDPRLARFQLAPASQLAPKRQGGLNIEGLAATPQGTLLIGFRNPLPEGRALSVELLNPLEVVHGVPPRLGVPLLLELEGLGIRGMTYASGAYWILAGPIHGEGAIKVFRWGGGLDQPMLTSFLSPVGLRWEGITSFTLAGKEFLWLVSDDGTVLVDGIEAKRLKNPLDKTFRALAVAVADLALAPRQIIPQEKWSGNAMPIGPLPSPTRRVIQPL